MHSALAYNTHTHTHTHTHTGTRHIHTIIDVEKTIVLSNNDDHTHIFSLTECVLCTLSIEQLMRPRDMATLYINTCVLILVLCTYTSCPSIHVGLSSKSNRVHVVVSKQEAFVLYR